MQTVTLSASAVAVLRFEIRGWKAKDPARRLPAYSELVAARIMIPLGSFSKGDECVFRFTYWGHKLRFELAGMDSPSRSDGSRPTVPATPSASPGRSPSPGR
jgi:hypothetical protein